MIYVVSSRITEGTLCYEHPRVYGFEITHSKEYDLSRGVCGHLAHRRQYT